MIDKTEMTIADAQSKMYSEFDAQLKTTCPCCFTTKRAYKRPLSTSMLQALHILVEYMKGSTQVDFHLESVLKSAACNAAIRGDAAKLRFWGLIERSEKSGGYYRLTPEASLFVQGEIKVPTHLVIYEGEVMHESETLLSWDKVAGFAVNEEPQSRGLLSGIKAAVKNILN